MEDKPTQAVELVAIMRREFDQAAHYDELQFWCQLGGAVLAAGVLLLPSNQAETACGLVLIGLVVAAVHWSNRSRERRSVGEQARRATILVNGLGIRMSPEDLMSLGKRSGISKADLERWNTPDYFAATEEPGLERAIKMVAESAFWTEELYGKSATVLLRRAFLVAGLLVVCLFIANGWLGATAVGMELRLLSVLASSFICWEVILRALSFSREQKTVNEIFVKLAQLKQRGYPRDGFFVLLLDYNSAVESAPLIVKGLHNKHKERLNDLWDRHKAEW